MKVDLSPTGWARVVLGTICGTLFCVAAALFVDSFHFHERTDASLRRAILIDIFLPVSLAVPLLFFLLYKLRQLAIAHAALANIAATDSLTTVLNRGAFETLVDVYLAKAREQALPSAGSLLVIDADNFKAINDRLGHQLGDEALRLIAGTIKGALRQADLVGRIGGEEFGVFLPGADPKQAEEVAERIRLVVSQTIFPPTGNRAGLTVSVGGVSFDRSASYQDLFHRADLRLYAAKSAGRNRVDIESLPSIAA